MLWIKPIKKPQTRQRILFLATSYGVQEPELGIYVEHYENEHGNHGNTVIGSNANFYKWEHISNWMELPKPPAAQ